jgi:hypothetical protein
MFIFTSPDLDRERLTAELARAQHCAPALFWRVVQARARSAMLADSAQMTAIRRLVEAAAWTDAALALVELEPQFLTVRRLQLDGGAWHCVLSQHRELPDWLDDAKEGCHPDLPLAILSALVQAPSVAAPGPQQTDKDARASLAICCENFA